MEQLEIFSKLNLQNVSENWVNLIWADNFLTFFEPPENYLLFLENENVNYFLKEICSVTRQWVKSASDDPDCDVSWRTLKTTNVNTKSLLAVLGYIIKIGQRSGANEDSRQSCLRATSLYLTLLSIPGSNIHEIFHPNLFHLAINTFKLLEYLVPMHKKPNKNADLADLYNDIEDDFKMTLTQQEKVTLTQGLNSIMYDMINTLHNFYLKDHERSLEVLVNCLVEIAKAETNINPLNIGIKSSTACLASLSYNAYIALKDLCYPNHGSVDVTIQLILKYIFQHILISHVELAVKNANILKETILKFLKILIDSYEKDAEKGFKILIQQMICKCPERLEARQKQALVVAKIINISQGKLYRNYIEYLVLFSHSHKITLRIFALEVTSKLLFETANQNDLSADDLLVRLQTRKILIGIVLSKCSDISNMARGKAMAIFTELTEKNNLNIYKEEFQIMFENESNNNDLPCLNQLKLGFTEDADPLPGSNSILNMLFKRVEDERALIRRSALQTLKNLAYFKSGIFNKVLPLIGRHCRDLSMTVRKFAIQMLTQMLQESPGNDCLLEEWVKSVVPQIFDIETKVQEKVLESMDQLILKELKMWNENLKDESAELPWRIINKLISLEMRKFLIKACTMWAGNGNIDNTYVTRVRTHIETTHEIQAWVLLATFSENFILNNMDLYFLNYNELIRSNKYHVKFMLEVLRNSWPKIDKELLQRMQADFYQSLCQFEVNFEYISVCIDILDRVMKYLQTNGERVLQANMLTLMKSSEAKINKIFNEDDSTDVCPLRVICTLGNSALICNGNVTSSTLNIIQGMLLDWKSVPLNLQNYTILRQFGIQILGQLGIRDREVAEQVTPILSCLMCQTSDEQSLFETTIRVNAAKILADLCERFTALVEPFLPEMCICMKDPNPRVREAIVVIFIQLLLEDFIKVKGLFFFHILTMISDPDETIRELTVFLIKERLIVKNKALIHQQFIRSMFHYNDCTSHQKVGEMKMSEKEKAVLMLSGIQNESKRRNIYDFMLEHVDPLGKVKLTENLTRVVLHGFCDDTLTIDGENEKCLLKDTLYILSSDYIQPNFNTNKQNDDEMQEEGVTPANVHNNVINCLMESTKTFKLQHLMPMLVKLELKLKDSKSSVLTDINRFFVQLVLEYNKEPFMALLNEYPELEEKIENIRKNGKKQLTDEGSKGSDDEGGRDLKKSYMNKNSKEYRATVLLPRLTNEQILQFSQISTKPSNQTESPAISDIIASNVAILPTPSKRSKVSRSRSSSISSISTYASMREMTSSTPIPFETNESNYESHNNVILKNIQNKLPEITDDESSDSDGHSKGNGCT